MTPTPLARALRLDGEGARPLVTFVGGGGKTTAMFTLATELAALGRRVVTTTTTRLFLSQRDESPAWATLGDEAALAAALERHGQCLVVGPDADLEQGKARGLPPDAVEALAARDDVDVLLVEADGSRGRPFKAPAPHEPVIPARTTDVVALIGASVFGRPLDEEAVHRPERVAALGGVPPGTPVSAELVANVLTHPEGGLQHVPSGARYVPFINQLEDEADRLQADRLASLLLDAPRVSEVLLGSLHQLGGAGALRRRSRAAAVVLAAGLATRFGATKQLLEWRGTTLVAHAAEVALDCCDTVIVVVGHDAEAVARAVDHLPVEVLFNPDYEAGQGSSVAVGVRALREGSRPPIGEALFLLADQPLVTADLLKQLRAGRALAPIALPRYRDRRGNPALFDAALFDELAALEGEAGGRALFDRYADEIHYVDVDDDAVLTDIDTPGAWASLRRRHGR